MNTKNTTAIATTDQNTGYLIFPISITAPTGASGVLPNAAA